MKFHPTSMLKKKGIKGLKRNWEKSDRPVAFRVQALKVIELVRFVCSSIFIFFMQWFKNLQKNCTLTCVFIGFIYSFLFFSSRAATIVSNGEGIIWGLDRVTFRKIVLKAAYLRVRFVILFKMRTPPINGQTSLYHNGKA